METKEEEVTPLYTYREVARGSILRTPMLRFESFSDLTDSWEQLGQATEEAWQELRDKRTWPRTGVKRQTPPEVRSVWPIAAAAVAQVFHQLAPEPSKLLTLNLSWGIHMLQYHLSASYREEVDEMRRIRERPSFEQLKRSRE